MLCALRDDDPCWNGFVTMGHEQLRPTFCVGLIFFLRPIFGSAHLRAHLTQKTTHSEKTQIWSCWCFPLTPAFFSFGVLDSLFLSLFAADSVCAVLAAVLFQKQTKKQLIQCHQMPFKNKWHSFSARSVILGIVVALPPDCHWLVFLGDPTQLELMVDAHDKLTPENERKPKFVPQNFVLQQTFRRPTRIVPPREHVHFWKKICLSFVIVVFVPLSAALIDDCHLE